MKEKTAEKETEGHRIKSVGQLEHHQHKHHPSSSSSSTPSSSASVKAAVIPPQSTAVAESSAAASRHGHHHHHHQHHHHRSSSGKKTSSATSSGVKQSNSSPPNPPIFAVGNSTSQASNNGETTSSSSTITASSTCTNSSNNNYFDDDYNELDISIGDLIIDLDADIEQSEGDKTTTTVADGASKPSDSPSASASSSSKALLEGKPSVASVAVAVSTKPKLFPELSGDTTSSPSSSSPAASPVMSSSNLKSSRSSSLSSGAVASAAVSLGKSAAAATSSISASSNSNSSSLASTAVVAPLSTTVLNSSTSVSVNSSTNGTNPINSSGHGGHHGHHNQRNAGGSAVTPVVAGPATVGGISAGVITTTIATGKNSHVEHHATVDKGLKMKIKRKSIGGKISDTKHEIVINTADVASPKTSQSGSSVGGKFPILPPSTGVVLGNSIPLASNAIVAISNNTTIPKSSPPDRNALSHGPNSSSSSPLAPSSVITATATTNNAVVVPTTATTNSIVLPIPPLALNQVSAASILPSSSTSATAAASAYINDLTSGASGKQSSKHSTSSKSSKSGGSSSGSSHRDKKEKNGKGDKGVGLPGQGTPVVNSPLAVGNALLKSVANTSQGLTKETLLDKDAPPTSSTSSASSSHLPGIPNLTLKYSASATSISAVTANLASTTTTISPCQTVILKPTDEMMASTAAALIGRSVAGSSTSALSFSLASAASNPTNPKKINAEDVDDNISEKRSVGTTTSIATITEPDCLGPCEPGTAVTLEGIVWQETEGGVLVVNVTWRGKTYVGTLLDCTKHDWAPPRFCESPTSDIESKSLKSGRGKRARGSFTDSTGIDTRSVTTSKLRNGKGRRTANSGFVPVSPAKGGAGEGSASSSSTGLLINSANNFGCATGGVSINNTSNSNDGSGLNVTGNSSNSKRKGRPGDLDLGSSTEENSGTSKRGRLSKNSESDSNFSQQTHTPCSPVLIECPEPNCSKKYKHINGLKYHQSHAHCGSNFNVVNDASQESSNSKDTFATDNKEDGLLSDGDGGDSVVDITDNATSTTVASKQDSSEGDGATKLLDSDKHHPKKLNISSADQQLPPNDANSNSCDAFHILDGGSSANSGGKEKNESSSCDQQPPLSRDENGRPKLGTFGPSDGDDRVGSPAYSDISDDTSDQVQNQSTGVAANMTATTNELGSSSTSTTASNSTSSASGQLQQQPPPSQTQSAPSDHVASEHLNRIPVSASSLQQQQQHQLQSQMPANSQHHPFGLSPFSPFFGQSPFGLPPPPGMGVESQHKMAGSDPNDPNGATAAAVMAANEADLFAYYRYGRRAAGLPSGLPPSLTPEQQHHLLLQQQHQQQLQQHQQQLKSGEQQNSIHQQQFQHQNSSKSGSPTNKEKHHSAGGDKSKDNSSSNSDNYNSSAGKPPIQELQNLKNRIQNYAFDQGPLYDAQKQQQLHQQQQRSFLEMHHGVSSEKAPETPTSKSSSSSSKQEKSSNSSKHHHSPHTKNMSKQQEDRNSKSQQQLSGNDEGVKPTMETTGPPPPTNGYYYNPSYLPPHSFAGMAGNAHHHAHMASSFDSMLRATMAANHHMALAAAGAGNPYGPPPPSHPHHPGFLQSQMARYGSPGNGGPMMDGMLTGRSSAPSPTTSTPTSAPKTSSSASTSSSNNSSNSMHHQQQQQHSFGANQLKSSERSSILSPRTSNSPGGPNHFNSSNSYKQSPNKQEHSHSPFSGGSGHPSGMNMAVSSGHGGLSSTASDPRNSMAGGQPPGMLQHQQQQQQAPRHPFQSAPHVGYSMFDPYSAMMVNHASNSVPLHPFAPK